MGLGEKPERTRGPYIWIVGPDGTGKSTLARRISEATGSLLLYWRPGVLPLAGRLLGRVQNGEVNSAPHEVTGNSAIKASLRLCYYAVDYVIGYWLVIAPACRAGKAVIVERGWGDMVVDWKRYGLTGPEPARRLGKVIRKPDLLLIISARPSVVRIRKPELPEREIERQLEQWRSTAWKKTEVLVVHNERPIDVVVAELVALVERRGVKS